MGRDRAVTRGGIHPDAQRLELVPEDKTRLRTKGIGCVDITEGDALPRVVDVNASRPVAIAAEEAEASLCVEVPAAIRKGSSWVAPEAGR